MIRQLMLLSAFVLAPSFAGAEESHEAILLGCSFGSTVASANTHGISQVLYVLYRVDGQRNETISVVDPDSLLAGTTLNYRKTTAVDGGELWTFSESTAEPAGTILMVLPKSIILASGREARPAALGQYHGSGLRNGACVIARGDEAIATFNGIGAGKLTK